MQKVRVTFPTFAQKMPQCHNDNQNPGLQNVMFFLAQTYLKYVDLHHPLSHTLLCQLGSPIYLMLTWITQTPSHVGFLTYIVYQLGSLTHPSLSCDIYLCSLKSPRPLYILLDPC